MVTPATDGEQLWLRLAQAGRTVTQAARRNKEQVAAQTGKLVGDVLFDAAAD